MRRAIINGVLIFAILMIMAFSGLGYKTWQYWAVFALYIATVINSML